MRGINVVKDQNNLRLMTETANVDTPLFTLKGITKSFSSVIANDHIDLEIRGGEIQALLGENGAGKSTLMKILYGFYRADAGEFFHRGRPVQIRSPHEARRLGIGMVFQNFTLIPALNVMENIAIFLPGLPFVLDRAGLAARIEAVSSRYGLTVDPWATVGRLSVGEQQKVEIIKLLLAEARVLVFDEPTKVLAPHEIDGLMQVFTNLRHDGYAVVFITHKLQEALLCADRITVMRRGKVAGTLPGSGATEDQLVTLMFGTAPVELRLDRTEPPSGTTVPVLELKDVATRAEGGAAGLQGINLVVRPGEIVGIAGISGNGQRELGDVVLGMERCARGAKYLFGRNATQWPVGRVRAAGVAFVPEDPQMAAVPSLTVLENMALGATWDYARRGGLSMDWTAVRQDTEQSLKDLGFSVPPLGQRAGTLSGGNFQRVILARELARRPRLIVAFYPTRGLDVPSAIAARSLLAAARKAGTGVLLISEDLGELFTLGDRLIVIHNGRIVGRFKPEETTLYEVGHLMTGAGSAHAASN